MPPPWLARALARSSGMAGRRFRSRLPGGRNVSAATATGSRYGRTQRGGRPLLLLVLADNRYPAAQWPGAWARSLAYVSFTAYLFNRIFFALLQRLIWPADPWSQVAVLVGLGLPVIWAGSLLIQWTYVRLLDSLSGNRRL